MSIVKKLRHKAETAEGSAEQAKGNAKQTGDKLKQKIRHPFKH